MTGNAISRIYFDSNCAFGWPAISKDLHWVIILARWLSVELYWPEAVDIELEAQFLRDIKEEADKLTAGQKRIVKRLRAVDVDPLRSFEMDLALATAAYSRKTEQLKADLGIRTVPTSGPDLTDFVRCAANRIRPFEEIPRGKRHAVTGFQDAVILSTIMAHLSEHTCPAGFATQDSVFSAPAVKDQIRDRGLDLHVYERLQDLSDELWERVAPSIRDGWEEDFRKAGEAVQSNLALIDAALLNIIDQGEIGRGELAEVVLVRRAAIKKVTSVRTELPDSRSMPPFSAGFNRKPGVTKIEASVWVDFDATVRPLLGGLVSMLVARTTGQSAQPDNQTRTSLKTGGSFRLSI